MHIDQSRSSSDRGTNYVISTQYPLPTWRNENVRENLRRDRVSFYIINVCLFSWLPYEKLKLVRHLMRNEIFYYKPMSHKLYRDIKTQFGYSVSAEALRSQFRSILNHIDFDEDQETSKTNVYMFSEFELNVLKAVKDLNYMSESKKVKKQINK